MEYNPEEYYQIKGKWLLILGRLPGRIDEILESPGLPSNKDELREWGGWIWRLLDFTIPTEGQMSKGRGEENTNGNP